MIYERYIKRFFDIIISLTAVIILSPLLLTLGILVRVKLGSPVFFRQKRPGRNGEIFTLCKFRTMTDERDEKGELLPDEERLTKFGKMLRSTSLDELPELFTILKGDMSLVGPRRQEYDRMGRKICLRSGICAALQFPDGCEDHRNDRGQGSEPFRDTVRRGADDGGLRYIPA